MGLADDSYKLELHLALMQYALIHPQLARLSLLDESIQLGKRLVPTRAPKNLHIAFEVCRNHTRNDISSDMLQELLLVEIWHNLAQFTHSFRLLGLSKRIEHLVTDPTGSISRNTKRPLESREELAFLVESLLPERKRLDHHGSGLRIHRAASCPNAATTHLGPRGISELRHIGHEPFVQRLGCLSGACTTRGAFATDAAHEL
mmetsp:Transcript_9512/g.21455  ORF Transcript_9512/g.21455 Transcript_9512/m.21455 type:complete len:203 (+) Transcript_9512:647-1255(+)